MRHRFRAAALAAAALAAASLGAAAVSAAGPEAGQAVAGPAQLFGRRVQAFGVQLSPDGKHAVFITPGPGKQTYVVVIDTRTHDAHAVGKQDGKPLSIVSCGWTSNIRIACKQAGTIFGGGVPLPVSRTIAVDLDGKNVLSIGRRQDLDALRISQFDGDILDWGSGDGNVLMARDYVPNGSTGGFDGLGVDRVDAGTGKGVNVERASKTVSDFLSDGQGNIRIRKIDDVDMDGNLTGTGTYMYRQASDREWRPFSKYARGSDAFVPVAVDGAHDVAYAVKSLDRRDALYRVALDGSFKAELVASHAAVDVNQVVTIGRHGRVIGAAYETDRTQIDYFDPDYKKLDVALHRALPQTPLIRILSASADEQTLVIWAGSDTDPGRYYVFDRAARRLEELVVLRPELSAMTMAPMKIVTFQAADGTRIPAYLTMPIGGAAKSLPTIVMPHGGPASRDVWGFDWLVQFFVQRGFAVLQPEYRGSSGYGDAFYLNNGFQSWETAMGDVRDAGRWLVGEGIADPARLTIVGWSYGGYAALQASVIEPGLFKAIVAIAPVTDLGMLKSAAYDYTDRTIVAQEVGKGDGIAKGSPARHADRIAAPVLMFQGDQDMNVLVNQSRTMDAALRRAGKQSTLVIFPGLDHQLDDSDARAKMLDQADRFLRTTLKIDG